MDHARPAPPRPRELAPGLAMTLVIAVLSTVIGQAVPVLGSAVPAVLAGVLTATLGSGRTAPLAPGARYASRWLLQIAIVVLGLRLSLADVLRVGVASLPVMIGTLLLCLAVARVVGRRLGVSADLQALIGCGTGICGASAIAAVAPVIGAAAADVAYAVSTIFVFNIAAVLVFPVLGHLLGLSQRTFGVFAGTAVNDVSSVVAAASTYGPQAAGQAVAVKLVRTLMIVPMVTTLAIVVRRREATAAGRAPQPLSVLSLLRLVPWFLGGFMVAALLDTLGVVPASADGGIGSVSAFLISAALAGIGLTTDVGAIRRTGHRPLLLGAALWVTVTAASLGLQGLVGLC